MTRQPSAQLSDEARSLCEQCGQPIWSYTTLAGDPVAVDNAPGEVIIDGRGHAFWSVRQDGYRPHSCSEIAWRAPLGAAVTRSEFLWL